MPPNVTQARVQAVSPYLPCGHSPPLCCPRQAQGQVRRLQRPRAWAGQPALRAELARPLLPPSPGVSTGALVDVPTIPDDSDCEPRTEPVRGQLSQGQCLARGRHLQMGKKSSCHHHIWHMGKLRLKGRGTRGWWERRGGQTFHPQPGPPPPAPARGGRGGRTKVPGDCGHPGGQGRARPLPPAPPFCRWGAEASAPSQEAALLW